MPAQHTPPLLAALLLHRCHQVGIFLARLVLLRLDFHASDTLQVNLIRAVSEAQRTPPCPAIRQRRVGTQPHRTEYLYCPFAHRDMHTRYERLDHGDLLACLLRAHVVYHPRGFQNKQPRLIDFDPRPRNRFSHRSELMQLLSKCRARLGPFHHQLERQFRCTDRAHAVMNPSRPEARLRERKSAALLAEQIRTGYAYVFEFDLTVSFRRHVIDYRDIADHLDARRITRHEDHALLAVARRVQVCLSHHDEEFAIRVRRVRDEPLPAINYVVVPR